MNERPIPSRHPHWPCGGHVCGICCGRWDHGPAACQAPADTNCLPCHRRGTAVTLTTDVDFLRATRAGLPAGEVLVRIGCEELPDEVER